MCLFGEELAELYGSGDGILRVVVHAAFADRLIDVAKAGRGDASGCIDGAEIGEGDTQRSVGGPSAFLVEVGHAEFIHPDLAALDVFRVVAYTDHNCLHFGQARVAHHADFVQLAIGVELGVDGGEADARSAFALGAVATVL